jgi:hypothetical protein
MAKNNFTTRERSALISLRSNGVSAKNLATAFGVTLGSVYSTTVDAAPARTSSRQSSAKPLPTAVAAPVAASKTTRARKVTIKPVSRMTNSLCN